MKRWLILFLLIFAVNAFAHGPIGQWKPYGDTLVTHPTRTVYWIVPTGGDTLWIENGILYWGSGADSTYATREWIAAQGYGTGGTAWDWADSAGEPPFWVDSAIYADTASYADSALGSVRATFADSTDLTNFNTDDLTQGSTNLYNQTHTGDVTGATGLTIAPDKIDSTHIKAGAISFSDIGQNTATTGEVMKWNVGGYWEPAADAGSGLSYFTESDAGDTSYWSPNGNVRQGFTTNLYMRGLYIREVNGIVSKAAGGLLLQAATKGNLYIETADDTNHIRLTVGSGGQNWYFKDDSLSGGTGSSVIADTGRFGGVKIFTDTTLVSEGELEDSLDNYTPTIGLTIDSFYVAESTLTVTGWKQTGDTLFIDTSSGGTGSGLDSAQIITVVRDSGFLEAESDTSLVLSESIGGSNKVYWGGDTLYIVADTTGGTTTMKAYSNGTQWVIDGGGGLTIMDSALIDSILYFVSGTDTTFITKVLLDSIRAGEFGGGGSTDSFYVAESASTTVGWKQSGDTIFIDTSSGSAGGLWDTANTDDTIYYSGTEEIIRISRDVTNDTTYLRAPNNLVLGAEGLAIADSFSVLGRFILHTASDSIVFPQSNPTDNYILKYDASGDSLAWVAESGGSGTGDTLIFNTVESAAGNEYSIVGRTIKVRPSASIAITREDSTTFDMMRFSIVNSWLDAVIDSSDIDHLSDYETVTNVAKIGDDTATWKAVAAQVAADSANWSLGGGGLWDTANTDDTIYYSGTEEIIRISRDVTNDSTYLRATGTLVLGSVGMTTADSLTVFGRLNLPANSIVDSMIPNDITITETDPIYASDSASLLDALDSIASWDNGAYPEDDPVWVADSSELFDFTQALSGDHTLPANGAKFGSSGTIFEGATSNGFEYYFSIPDPSSSDKTATFQNSSGTVAYTSDVVTDHGGLSGLEDDDHTQYLKESDTAAFAATIDSVAYVDKFKGEVTPNPAATSGQVRWDSDNYRIVVGSGGGDPNNYSFYPGAHVGPTVDSLELDNNMDFWLWYNVLGMFEGNTEVGISVDTQKSGTPHTIDFYVDSQFIATVARDSGFLETIPAQGDSTTWAAAAESVAVWDNGAYPVSIADSSITVGKIDHSDAETNWLDNVYLELSDVDGATIDTNATGDLVVDTGVVATIARLGDSSEALRNALDSNIVNEPRFYGDATVTGMFVRWNLKHDIDLDLIHGASADTFLTIPNDSTDDNANGVPDSWDEPGGDPDSIYRYSILHPSVKYVPEGKWGYKYHGVFTGDLPYSAPGHSEAPLYRVSNDGTTWIRFGSVPDPLMDSAYMDDSCSYIFDGHFSDNSLFWDAEGDLWMVFRTTATGGIDKLWVSKFNGTRWSIPVLIIDGEDWISPISNYDADLISPTVILDVEDTTTRYKMFFVELNRSVGLNAENTVFMVESVRPDSVGGTGGWPTDASTATLTSWYPKDTSANDIWHIEVIPYGPDCLFGLGVVCNNNTTDGSGSGSLFAFKSLDGGVNWTIADTNLLQSGFFAGGFEYRSSGYFINTPEGDAFDLFYSGQNSGGYWRTCRTTLYSGDTTVIRSKEATIWHPHTITDTIPIFNCDSLEYPNGIKILSLSCQASDTGVYALKVMTFDASDPAGFHDWIDTLNIATDKSIIFSSTFEDGNAPIVYQSQKIYLLTSATERDWIRFQFRYEDRLAW